MFISAARPRLGLVLGLGLASFSCTGGDGGTTTTVADSADSQEVDTSEADAVTYAGPDTWTGDVTTSTPPTTTTTNNDTSEADAVTYAGPDETTAIGDATVGTATDTSSTGTTDSGEPCVPITDDPSGIGGECSNDGDCLAGYTCQPFQGIVLEMACQVLCEQTCECPAGLVCTPVADKSGAAWNQCM